MTTQLTKSAQSVQNALNQANLTCKVVELPSSTRTAAEAAASIGCDISQIVKSLIFKTKTTEQPVLVLASGPNRVNEKQIETEIGQAITKADADFTRDITGFAIGGIPPIGHRTTINLIFIDESLLNHTEVWAAAGTPNAIFALQSNHLLKLTKGKIIKFI